MAQKNEPRAPLRERLALGGDGVVNGSRQDDSLVVIGVVAEQFDPAGGT